MIDQRNGINHIDRDNEFTGNLNNIGEGYFSNKYIMNSQFMHDNSDIAVYNPLYNSQYLRDVRWPSNRNSINNQNLLNIEKETSPDLTAGLWNEIDQDIYSTTNKESSIKLKEKKTQDKVKKKTIHSKNHKNKTTSNFIENLDDSAIYLDSDNYQQQHQNEYDPYGNKKKKRGRKPKSETFLKNDYGFEPEKDFEPNHGSDWIGDWSSELSDSSVHRDKRFEHDSSLDEDDRKQNKQGLLTKLQIENALHLSQQEAAMQYSCCVSTVKRAFKKYYPGQRWPSSKKRGQLNEHQTNVRRKVQCVIETLENEFPELLISYEDFREYQIPTHYDTYTPEDEMAEVEIVVTHDIDIDDIHKDTYANSIPMNYNDTIPIKRRKLDEYFSNNHNDDENTLVEPENIHTLISPIAFSHKKKKKSKLKKKKETTANSTIDVSNLRNELKFLQDALDIQMNENKKLKDKLENVSNKEVHHSQSNPSNYEIHKGNVTALLTPSFYGDVYKINGPWNEIPLEDRDFTMVILCDIHFNIAACSSSFFKILNCDQNEFFSKTKPPSLYSYLIEGVNKNIYEEISFMLLKGDHSIKYTDTWISNHGDLILFEIEIQNFSHKALWMKCVLATHRNKMVYVNGESIQKKFTAREYDQDNQEFRSLILDNTDSLITILQSLKQLTGSQDQYMNKEEEEEEEILDMEEVYVVDVDDGDNTEDLHEHAPHSQFGSEGNTHSEEMGSTLTGDQHSKKESSNLSNNQNLDLKSESSSNSLSEPPIETISPTESKLKETINTKFSQALSHMNR